MLMMSSSPVCDHDVEQVLLLNTATLAAGIKQYLRCFRQPGTNQKHRKPRYVHWTFSPKKVKSISYLQGVLYNSNIMQNQQLNEHFNPKMVKCLAWEWCIVTVSDGMFYLFPIFSIPLLSCPSTNPFPSSHASSWYSYLFTDIKG